jgi:hypothetical protein
MGTIKVSVLSLGFKNKEITILCIHLADHWNNTARAPEFEMTTDL